ncbi:MAG: hypothetical protein AABZ23_06520 [Deltaproteobacteria bacterium]
MNLRRRICILSALIVFSVLYASPAAAYPFFAGQIGRNCTFCHALFPRLNEEGRVFRSNGFLFDEEEMPRPKEAMLPPLSMEVEIEGFYKKENIGADEPESADIVLEELELISGASFGPGGRVSALGIVLVSEENDEFKASLPNAFIQVNDINGASGEGRLNLRAGRFQTGPGLFNAAEAVVGGAYLADIAMGIIRPEDGAVELNGILLTSDAESFRPTHRYSLGFARGDEDDGIRLKGYYLSYSASFMESLSVGAIYRNGTFRNESFSGLGVAAELDRGFFIMSIGYFASYSGAGGPDKDDIVLEAVLFPMLKTSLLLRYDVLNIDGSSGVRSHAVAVRYDMLDNAYAKIEYAGTTDRDNVFFDADEENEARVILAAAF